MKICIVGNSHIAALKLAAAQGAAEFPSLEIDFWGGAGQLYHKVFVDEGTLKAPAEFEEKFLAVSEGRHASINPKDFDLIVFHGAGLDTFRPVFAISRRFARNPKLPQEAIEAVTWEWLKDKLTFRLATQLRATSATPIVFSPIPNPSEDMRLQSENLKEASPEIYARFMNAFRICAKRAGFEVVLQPEHTLSRFANYTREEYSINSVRLHDTSERHSNDVMHMNEKYGAEVLKAIKRHVDSKSWG